VALVGALSFGMPVAETAQADTSVTVLKILATVATGGGMGVAAAPEEAGAGMACAAALPLCAVVAAGTIGAVLYATHDTWMPWIKNGFGAGGSSVTGEGCGSRWCGYWNAQPVAGVMGGGFSYNVSTVGTPGVVEAQTTWDVYCLDSGGAPHHYSQTDNLEMGSWVGGHYSGTITVSNPCAGGSITSVAGNPEQNGQNYGPNMTWGTSPPLVDSGIQVSNQVSCINPDGSTYSVIQGVTGMTGSLAPMPTCTGAAGSQPGAHGVCVTTSAGPVGGALVQQASSCANAAAAAALYPNCVGGGVACSYVVKVDNVPCVVGGVCSGWTSIYASDPARVRCMYGAYSAPVADCAFLERAYEVGGAPATQANTDGNPATWTNPSPAGTPVGGASMPTPAVDTPALPVPTAANPTSNADCFGATYQSFNPVEWVLTPIKCAFVWAWVPSPGTIGPAVGDFQRVWSSKPPGSLVVGASSVFSSIGTGWDSGCGSAASASFSQPALGHPLQLPCSPSGGGAGSVAYTAMQIALIVSTLIGLWHMVAAGISAQATGGGD
jgi:hypothetical protein